MAEPVSDEELLRLARKAWPGAGPFIVDDDAHCGTLFIERTDDEGALVDTLLFVQGGASARRSAAYRALLDMAGEEHPDVTKLREDRHAKNNLVQILQALGERAVGQLVRAGANDDAARLQADIGKAMERT